MVINTIVKALTIMQRNKSGAILALVIIALLASGLVAGRLLGLRLVESVVLNQNRLPLLLSQPVNQFYNVYSLINSGNMYSRLSGYYGLKDNRMIDEKFLTERFKTEKDPVVRRTLAWVLSFSEDPAPALKFYASIFPESDDSLKKELLRLMKRIDEAYYRDFVVKNRVNKALIPE
jgi:hypothetical protein